MGNDSPFSRFFNDSRRTLSSVYELLAAEPRIHAHDQNEIDDSQDFIERRHGRCRVDHYTRERSQTLNHLQGAIHAAGFTDALGHDPRRLQ